MQTRKHSLFEAITSMAIVYGVAVTTQCIIFPWFGLYVPLTQNLLIGGIFTIVSVARGYAVRRLFNWIEGK